MASSIVSKLVIFSLISSMFHLFSIPNIIATRAIAPVSSESLIQTACASTQDGFNKELCIKILQSKPQIASANNLFDLSIHIIETGISNVTKTRAHIEDILNDPNGSNLKSALRNCKLSYDSVVVSLNSALIEVRDAKEYQTATYDLMVASTDNIQLCRDVVAKEKINDVIILSGNRVVPIFGFSAYEAVESLLKQSLLASSTIIM